jgi:glycosyltransferase involved in cell wall biosynthesis
MKIVLVANYLPDRQESMLRYASMLERELRARGHEVSVVSPPRRLANLFRSPHRFSKWIGYVDKYLLASRHLRAGLRDADIVHICDHSNSMYLRLAGKTPSVITCHDLLAVFAARGRYPGVHIGRTGRLLQRWIGSGLLRARMVVCVSQKTREDLLELAASEEQAPQTAVVLNPLNWDFHPVPHEKLTELCARRGLPELAHYFIHVGGDSWYKNRPAAVRIFANLKRSAEFQNAILVLAGKPWHAELQQTVAESGCASAILELTDVSNEELRALYSNAIALLFPSRHEGFGWPILEAQACGCPVITSDRAPVSEVAGGAAILIDPEDPVAAAEQILRERHRLAELPAAGFANLPRFSIDRAIEGYLAAYQAAIFVSETRTASHRSQ